MTDNVNARQIASIIKKLTIIPGVVFTGNSDVFFLDCEKKSMPKYEFKWSPEDGKYNIYEYRKMSRDSDRVRINFISLHLYRVLDAADFIIMYKLMYRNRANQK